MKIELNDMQETNELLNLVLENINSAVFLVDNQARIININNPGTILFNKPASSMIGELCGNAIGCINPYFYKVDCGTTPKCIKCGIRNSIISSFTEHIPTTKSLLKRSFVIDNVEVPKTFLYSTRIIRVSGVDRVIIIVDDMTESEKQKELLIELNEEKNRFLAIAAHDLRNPIAIIQMYAKSYLDFFEKNLTKQQLDLIGTIFKKSKYMITLLEDLLDISKIESGIHDLTRKMVEYISFVDNIIANNQLIARNKDMTIALTSTIPGTFISIDEMKIEQVISNLIQNAIKYSHRGSKIIIQLSREENFIKTEVIDQGIGIPLDKQIDLFKPFISLISMGTEGEKSVGLGLNIVKKIVEAHSGSVGVVSEPGKGSNFYFLLPITC